jgi:hypothetical protein
MPFLAILALLTFLIRRGDLLGLNRSSMYLPALFLIVLGAAWIGGCGGGGGGGGVHNPGTPKGTYTLTLTGSSAGVHRSASLTLTVN